MKKLAFLILLATTTGAHAAEGPLTSRMSCQQVQGAVAKRGAAMLTFSERGYDRSSALTALATFGNHPYDRVVADHRFCLPRQAVTPIWVPTPPPIARSRSCACRRIPTRPNPACWAACCWTTVPGTASATC